MKAATSCEPTLQPEARDFLRQHQGESAFQKACELVRACFPEMTALDVHLLEDPDEENHTWVVLDVLMPASHPRKLLQAQEAHYYEQLARQMRLPYHPFSFSLIVHSIQD
jgi:hypothetical protein